MINTFCLRGGGGSGRRRCCCCCCWEGRGDDDDDGGSVDVDGSGGWLDSSGGCCGTTVSSSSSSSSSRTTASSGGCRSVVVRILPVPVLVLVLPVLVVSIVVGDGEDIVDIAVDTPSSSLPKDAICGPMHVYIFLSLLSVCWLLVWGGGVGWWWTGCFVATLGLYFSCSSFRLYKSGMVIFILPSTADV
jgi:hypothetical protein